MKKIRSDGLAITAVMIALIVVVWTGMARASAEEDMFTATTQPDALIILDLSGSMSSAPSGNNIYGATSACTADTAACSGVTTNYPYNSTNSTTVGDTLNCKGAPDPSNYRYAAAATCAASPTQCVGSAFAYPDYADYPYAHDETGAPNAECNTAFGTDCNGSYCKSPKSKTSGSPKRYCQTPRSTPLCKNGFCKTSKTGCDVDCNFDCNTAGFCKTSKPGCDVYVGGSCSGGFCRTNAQTDCNVDCSKLAIAKRSIFSFLDDNNDGQITGADKTSLGVRMGYMSWTGCSDSSQEGEKDGKSPTYSYSTGCNTLVRGIDSPYSAIYCGDNTSCSSSTAGSGTSGTVSGANAGGYTPISTAQVEAKLYLYDHEQLDAAKACRNKFVILITDGADTMVCNPSSTSTNAPQRRESVAKAKALADAGYKVFVIGFGAAMPPDEKNTLNWMAYYGRTDDPNTANTGSAAAYNIVTGCMIKDPVTGEKVDPAVCCDVTPGACYPSGVASCSASTSNDPGTIELGGYAYIAADADALAAALRSTINIIRQANYSFSQASIQASRTTDENFLYEGSFEPADSSEPFWKGFLKKYPLDENGAVGAPIWDAGEKLRDRTTSRNILTHMSVTFPSALTDFNTTNTALTAAHLGVTTADERTEIIGYIHGDANYNPEVTSTTPPWKLGDVFRSMPITVGTPSSTFNDVRDCNNQFAAHRTAHPRTSANGLRMIVVGANDGQLHAFKTTSAGADAGKEAWSFVPPNLLPKLKNLTHSQHPANQTHQYFDDGPITVADIWDGTTTTGCASSCSGNGECKAAGSWKTVMVFGEGRGAVDYAWSNDPSCATGLRGNYSVTAGTPAVTTTYPHYCGYHALNLTDTSQNPAYMWHLNFVDATATANQAPYLGDPWSKMMIGRVRVKESGEVKEKWVGFIGAGYNGSNCTGSGACDTRGKGFLAVDLTNGQIVWSYTHQNNADMDYSIPAPPAIVDTDSDGFIDTAYIGDLGGNMWRFAFCRAEDGDNCGISNWSGGKFFDGIGNTKPIYTSATVAKDASANIWVYWATGNKIAPTAKTGIQEYLYGVKDGRPSTPYNADNDLTTLEANDTTTFDPTSSKAGFRIKLAYPNLGEKVLSDPTVFGGNVYFTSYTPSEGTDACNQSGTARLYGINYTTAAGAIPGTGGTSGRSMIIGSGIPSAPVISMKPGSNPSPDLYVTTSGTGGGSTGTTVTPASTRRVSFDPPGSASRTNMLYWKDRRIQ